MHDKIVQKEKRKKGVKKMSLVIPNRSADLFLFLLFCGTILYYTYLASKGKSMELKKKLPALEAIPEAIGRAVEMGRPIHYTPGGNPLYGVRGTHIQMGLVILGHVSRWAARLGAKLIVSIARPAGIPLAEEIVRGAFIAEGKPEVEPDIRFYSTGDAPFGAGCINTIATEKVAVNMIIGGSGSDFPMIAEGAFRAGAFQIGGSANVWMIPLVVASCEYTLIGDELFAAGAMLSEDNIQLAGIVANDISKIIIVALICIGSILATMGLPIIGNLLKL